MRGVAEEKGYLKDPTYPDLRRRLAIRGVYAVKHQIDDNIMVMRNEGFECCVVAYRHKDVVIPCDDTSRIQTVVFSEVAMVFFKTASIKEKGK